MTQNGVPHQLDLRFSHSEHSLRDYLEKRLGSPLSLVLTDNASTMLSVRLKGPGISLRLHRMFASAGDAVLDEIASYLKKRRSAMPLFRSFVRDNRALLSIKAPNRVAVRTTGKFHDLRNLYDEINREYFGGTVTAAITWGTRCSRARVRKRTLGSYSERSKLIRINPVLDKKAVPRFYVAFVVYHEMLHAAFCAPFQRGRRSIHSREFRKREKNFKDYERAVAWEGRNA